jgi:hypothetical protein
MAAARGRGSGGPRVWPTVNISQPASTEPTTAAARVVSSPDTSTQPSTRAVSRPATSATTTYHPVPEKA